MTNNFKGISLAHQNSPITLRERFSLDEAGVRSILLHLKEQLGISEALVLSTCNRTEVYYIAEEDLSEAIVKVLCVEKGISFAEKLLKYFTNFHQEEQAVRHLFRVAIGLESQVVGDLQITHQIKRAYQACADLEMAGPFLHRLMHTIFFTNKKVVQETPFRDGAASVSYAAVEMLEELTANLLAPKILVLGVGEIGADVVRHLKEREVGYVHIANRTYDKAVNLAQECGFEAIPFDQVWQEIEAADVVISSVSLPEPFLSKERMGRMHVLSFKYLIDLSVPRSVAADVEQIPGMLVYNVDDIQQRATAALKRRLASVPDVEMIVNYAIEEFKIWAREMIFSPAIQKFKEALEQIRQEEVRRYMRKMDEEEAKKVDAITKGIINKIIRMPVMQLKAACRRGDAENLALVLQDLFNLEGTFADEKAH